MSGHPTPIVAALLLSAVLSASGCSTPSYRHEQMAQAIQEICVDEYHLPVSVRKVGQTTVAVHLHHTGILQHTGGQIGLAPDAGQLLGNVVEAIHRVALSTDKPIEFYVLSVSDPEVPGVYLMMVRYLDDVRRVHANIIPPSEFFMRTIFELKPGEVPSLVDDRTPVQEVTMEEFLTWQLAQRIQGRLSERINSQPFPTAQVGQCTGEFHRGEFRFVLNVSPRPGLMVDDTLIQQAFEDATTVIAQVLSGYRFERFDSIRLIHPVTGRHLLLGKSQLELFR